MGGVDAVAVPPAVVHLSGSDLHSAHVSVW